MNNDKASVMREESITIHKGMNDITSFMITYLPIH